MVLLIVSFRSYSQARMLPHASPAPDNVMSEVQSCMPSVQIIVWSGTGILSCWNQPCHPICCPVSP